MSMTYIYKRHDRLLQASVQLFADAHEHGSFGLRYPKYVLSHAYQLLLKFC